MKKLFLTSFKFKNSEGLCTDQRLVVVTPKCVAKYKEEHAALEKQSGKVTFTKIDELDTAYHKAKKWFDARYPSTELVRLETHEAIE